MGGDETMHQMHVALSFCSDEEHTSHERHITYKVMGATHVLETQRRALKLEA
jgi:hypothetical protein